MAVNPITAAMSIELPTPGQTESFGIAAPGESWGELYNSGFNTVDAHDHTTGRGLAITSSAININGDLDFNTENLIGLRSARFDAISLGTLGVSDIGCLIVSGADLYYVDTAGNQVQMTSGGAVAGAPGSISGLAAPASASYSAGPKLFSFDSGVNTVGGVACGPLVLTDSSVPSGFAATIQVPAGLGANYQLTLLSALPGATKILSLSSAGVIAAAMDVDNSTLQISSNIISVKNSGITATQLATDSVITAKILAANVTRPKLEAVGQQISSSCGNFTTTSASYVDVTNLTVTITTSGRPVVVMLVPDGDVAHVSGLSTSRSAVATGIFIAILRGATKIYETALSTQSGSAGTPSGLGVMPAVSAFDPVAAGTYTYKVQTFVLNVGDTAGFGWLKLVAYEL